MVSRRARGHPNSDTQQGEMKLHKLHINLQGPPASPLNSAFQRLLPRLKMSLWGLDVSTAFLYATLDEPQAVVLPASRVVESVCS